MVSLPASPTSGAVLNTSLDAPHQHPCRSNVRDQYGFCFLFFFYCLMPSQLPAVGLKVCIIPKSVLKLQLKQTMVQLDPGSDHLFFVALNFGSLGSCSKAHFTHVNLGQTKLKCLKVWTKQGRCESALRLNDLKPSWTSLICSLLLPIGQFTQTYR